jgi:hypothetical protein
MPPAAMGMLPAPASGGQGAWLSSSDCKSHAHHETHLDTADAPAGRPARLALRCPTRRTHRARLRVSRLRPGLRLHGPGGAGGRKPQPPPGMVQCLQQGEGDAPERADWTIDQGWAHYTPQDHAVWKTLFERQTGLLPGRACDAFVQGMRALPMRPTRSPLRRAVRGADAPHRLAGGGGAGPGARRGVLRPPGAPALSGRHFIRRPRPAGLPGRARCVPRRVRPCADADEPGHGRLHPGLRPGRAARAALGVLEQLARVYWYTVEFGLVQQADAACASMARASPPQRRIGICLEMPRPTASASIWSG